ncbi:unnamed protein product [Phyllotreta striolata]|uniref:Uncharacterized protein n=1 Tax=Phyllotreta striolata TaxID=444603 RepID=A0A9N9XMB1_PHYSR|nr:unnamed protein product [Phyllotreta striolata]
MFKVAVLSLFGLIILSVQGISLTGKKYNNSFTKCQDLQNPGTLEANVRYNDSDVRDEVYILLPEKGDFKRPISCIKVIDNSSYNASEVVIVQGGLNHQFAIFKIYIHSILADYDYTFQIYTR